MIVDHDSDVPPYRQIAAHLRARITSGELTARARLPSLETIMQEYGVARTTARKAVQLLVSEGLVRTVPGWGTRVIPEEERSRGDG